MARKDDRPPTVHLWMPWFIERHRARSATLSHTEHSALCFFNMLLWERGGELPDADQWIARQLRLTLNKWRKIKPAILEGCEVGGGRISDPHMMNEYAKAQRNVEQKRFAGLKSAASRENRSNPQKPSLEPEQNFNERTNGGATAGQPRAGSGSGPFQERGSLDRDTVGPFAVLNGGKAAE